MSQPLDVSLVKMEEISEVVTIGGVRSDTGSDLKIKLDNLDSDLDSPPPEEAKPHLSHSPISDISSPPMSRINSPNPESPRVEFVTDEVSTKLERSVSQPKLSRTASQRGPKRAINLYTDSPDLTAEAKKTFKVVKACSYDPKWLGQANDSEETMSCDCRPQFSDGANQACGPDSDCINRMMCMECSKDEGTCGGTCRNQRFQNREYADVSVIDAGKKGYGLRTNVDMAAGTFILEYVGEVIDTAKYYQRKAEYAEEGIKHFYFMSIKKGEFVDATKKGGIARFCNHSCAPNSEVEKWVVGERLRMGIFAKTDIKAGEELTFDYNVDRYGSEPTACFCGESNCIGFIGGKSQTEAATKLPALLCEALGIDGADGWHTATAKKPKRKKASEDDEDYVANFKTLALEKTNVQKVMGALRQSSERWQVIRMLDRIAMTDDMAVQMEVMRIHGYQIFNSLIKEWREDPNIVITILETMNRWPAMTKNKISSSKIESAVHDLIASDNENVHGLAEKLVAKWSELKMAYRIPRRIIADEPVSTPGSDRKDSKETSKSNSPEPTPQVVIPTGPKNPGNSQPRMNFVPNPRPPRPKKFNHVPSGPRQQLDCLPMGWASAVDQNNGKTYYYHIDTKRTQWDFPRDESAAKPPPPPAPAPLPIVGRDPALAKIIENAISRPKVVNVTPQITTVTTKTVTVTTEKKQSSTYSEERRIKLLKDVFAKVVANCVFKYEKEIADRAKTKKYAKEITELLVNKEMRAKGGEISLEMNDNRKKKVKLFVKTYMDKVIRHLKEKRARRAAIKAATGDSPMPDATPATDSPNVNGDDGPSPDVDMSPSMKDFESPATGGPSRETTQMPTPHSATPVDYKLSDSPKRKREEDDNTYITKETITTTYTMQQESSRPVKRARSGSQSPARLDTVEPEGVTAA